MKYKELSHALLDVAKTNTEVKKGTNNEELHKILDDVIYSCFVIRTFIKDFQLSNFKVVDHDGK